MAAFICDRCGSSEIIRHSEMFNTCYICGKIFLVERKDEVKEHKARFIVEDDRFGLYGLGDTIEEAAADYREAFAGYKALVSIDAKTSDYARSILEDIIEIEKIVNGECLICGHTLDEYGDCAVHNVET